MVDPKQVVLDPTEAHTDRSALLESLIAHDDPATTALLGVFALVLDDDLARRRCASELSGRRWSTPPWFRALGDVTVEHVVESADPLGDLENLYLELHWPTGQVLTIVAYIDHNLGSVVKDAFTVPMEVEEMIDVTRPHVDEQELTFVEVDPADARARLEQAIEWSNRTVPPIETETWPVTQPLLRWALRLLPSGGEAPISWVVANANGRLHHGDTGQMLASIGVKGSVSGRAKPLLGAIGAGDLVDTYDPHLGTPRYLTSARREGMTRRREGR